MTPMETGSALAGFSFLTRPVDRPADRFVESIWYARGSTPFTREKIAPTGSTVAVFVLGEPIIQIPGNGTGHALYAERGFLIGPHDRPAVNEPVGETFAVGIVTTSVGCEAVFGIRPAPLRGKTVDLETVWPAAGRLRDDLLSSSSPELMLDLLNRHMTHTVDPRDPDLEACETAVALLDYEPTRPIAEVAAEVGLSHGQLDRVFTRVVGLSPRVLARLIKVRRLLTGIDVRDDVRWIDLATEQGWFDQPHLIRDFKRHTGVTPSEYVAAQRAYFSPRSPGDAAGFVPTA